MHKKFPIYFLEPLGSIYSFFRKFGGQREDSNGRNEATWTAILIHHTNLSLVQSSSCKVASCAQTSYDTRTFPNHLKLQEPCTDLITCFVPVSEFTQSVQRYRLMVKRKA
jgi:hypothetical protein